MLTFLHPWLAVLLPLPLIVRRFVPPIERTDVAIRVPFFDRISAATGDHDQTSHQQRLTEKLLAWAIWVLILTALCRPQWLEPPVERVVPTRDLLLLVDLSASMDKEDFTDSTGARTDRLDAVKEVVGDFLVEREGDRVGLVVFGNSPFLQVPFTTDLNLCQQLLLQTDVGMAGPKTALGDAIGLGIQLFEDSDTPTKTIIALTDGNDTSSDVPPVEAARIAKDRQITIHTVAVGDPTTVGEEKLDEEALKSVAQSTGGQFFLALDRKELAGIYDQLDKIETREVKTVSFQPRRDLYYWPLIASLLLSLLVHAGRLINQRRQQSQQSVTARLRVNTRTFELEAVDR